MAAAEEKRRIEAALWGTGNGEAKDEGTPDDPSVVDLRYRDLEDIFHHATKDGGSRAAPRNLRASMAELFHLDQADITLLLQECMWVSQSKGDEQGSAMESFSFHTLHTALGQMQSRAQVTHSRHPAAAAHTFRDSNPGSGSSSQQLSDHALGAASVHHPEPDSVHSAHL